MLEQKEYKSLNCIPDDTNICEEVETNYSGYICDAIAEAADSAIHIYYSDLWETAPKIQEYIEEAIAEGLVDTNKFDLIKAFQAGEYQYYTQVLYDNFETIVFNIAVNYINEKYPDVDIDEDELQDILTNIDKNSQVEDIAIAIDDFLAD